LHSNLVSNDSLLALHVVIGVAEFCLGSLPETQRGYGTPIYYNPNLGGVLTYGSGNLAFIRNYKVRQARQRNLRAKHQP
jgi:hypothetical protein